jgi:hypothetical protein
MSPFTNSNVNAQENCISGMTSSSSSNSDATFNQLKKRVAITSLPVAPRSSSQSSHEFSLNLASPASGSAPSSGSPSLKGVHGNPDVFASLNLLSASTHIILPPSSHNSVGNPVNNPNSYQNRSILSMTRERFGVLATLLVLQSLSSVILQNYSALLEHHVEITLFLTMVSIPSLSSPGLSLFFMFLMKMSPSRFC